MSEQPNRRQKGKWRADSFLNALERRYALLKGRYETIEQECETVVGVAALLEAQDRVESDKKLMKRVLDAIEIVGRDVDPDWSPAAVKPIYPKHRDNSTGRISKTAWNVMRKAGRPMKAREIAKEVVAALGEVREERTVARFEIAIRAALDRRVGQDIEVTPGVPRRYAIIAEEAL